VGQYARNTIGVNWGTFIAKASYSAGCDSDNDGWSDGAETTIGTDPALACGADAWPADINNDTFVDIIADIIPLTNNFGVSVPPAPARHNIAPDPPDGFVDIFDIVRESGLFGASCVGG